MIRDPKTVRNVMVNIRLTESEARRVTKAAKKAGSVTVSDYLRTIVKRTLDSLDAETQTVS